MSSPARSPGRIYIACTKSEDRDAAEGVDQWSGRDVEVGVNAANPRPDNRSGHIIEIAEAGDDATATRFEWNVFLLAGNPAAGRFIVDARELAPGKLGRAGHLFRRLRQSHRTSARCIAPTISASIPQGRLWIVTDSDNRGQSEQRLFRRADRVGRNAAASGNWRVARWAAKSAAANSRPTAARCS